MVEVALASGAKAAHLVENADAIDPAWLEGVSTVGLSSGASVPEVLVQEAMQWLAARGYGDVDEVTQTEERLTFALPQELRRELRGAASG
jgi:4-hydroxy-3-methylbut-2-enyl diphosphate reductase